MVNKVFSYTFKGVKLATIEGGDIEQNKFDGQVATIMRVLTSTDGDLKSRFDKINVFKAEIGSVIMKHLILNIHDVAANEGETKTINTRRYFWIL